MFRKDRTLFVPQTVRCRMHLQCMMSPPRDARLVEDAASGVSVQSLQQANANVPHALRAEHDSPMARHDFSNGETAKPTITTYMHIVQMADLDMIMNYIARQRDTITRTATDTEVRLPFAQDPDQASTAAPPDDERDLFGRKEALRMEEESWTSSGSNMLHGTASKTCVAQRTSNLTSHEVQIFVAASPTRHSPSHHAQQPNLSGPGKPGWCIAAGSSWDHLQSMPLRATVQNLDARMELFWAEDWSAVWAMVRAECDVAPVQNTTCRTEKQQMQSRIRKVATLARTGEKGRALVAARNALPVPVTKQIVQEIKSLYPADPEPLAPASAPISALFLSEVAEHVPTKIRKMPRLSEPGPLGMRAEHWYDFGSLATHSRSRCS